MRLSSISKRIFSAGFFLFVALSDSTALSVTLSESISSDQIATSVTPDNVNRATTEVQIRRLRALLISSDQSTESSIYDRLENLQSRTGSINRN